MPKSFKKQFQEKGYISLPPTRTGQKEILNMSLGKVPVKHLGVELLKQRLLTRGCNKELVSGSNRNALEAMLTTGGSKMQKFKALSINYGKTQLDKEAKQYIKRETKRNPAATCYSVIGYSSDEKCTSMAHGALLVRFEDGREIVLEWGKVTATNDSAEGGTSNINSRLVDTKHPTSTGWFVRQIRVKKVKKVKKVTLKDVLTHAEAWVANRPANINYPYNCFGYVDSAIVSVFGDSPISTDARGWALKKARKQPAQSQPATTRSGNVIRRR